MLANTMLAKKFEYNHWANNRILTQAANVTPEQWTATHDYSQGGLHQTMYHVLRVEQSWLHIAQFHQRRTDLPPIEQLPTVDSLRTFAETGDQIARAYLDAVSEDALAEPFSVTRSDGSQVSFVAWEILTHLLYHSAQHRSEAAYLLTRYGQSPGDLDFIFFV